METFWMIHCTGGGAPNVRHQSHDVAKAEAERLARTNPGREFFVLQATGCARKVDVEYIECDVIPF